MTIPRSDPNWIIKNQWKIPDTTVNLVPVGTTKPVTKAISHKTGDASGSEGNKKTNSTQRKCFFFK